MKILEDNLNKYLQLEAIDFKEKRIGPKYKTKIIEIIDNYTINISFPEFETFIIPFPPNTRIKLYIEDYKTYHALTGYVMSKNAENNTVIIQKDKKETHENNLVYNTMCDIPGKYKYLTIQTNSNSPESENIVDDINVILDLPEFQENESSNIDISKEEQDYNYLTIKELGTTYIKTHSNQILELEKLIELEFKLNEKETINTRCKVIKTSEFTVLDVTICESTINFIELSSAHKEKIEQYIFDVQSKLLKKGNIIYKHNDNGKLHNV